MVPVGDQPIPWNLMHYYSQFGHKDFVLCLGYKANVTKEYFLNYKPRTYADCAVSGFGNEVGILGDPQQDWATVIVGGQIYGRRSPVGLLDFRAPGRAKHRSTSPSDFPDTP
jgi:glucose-1-phosphate cytidylyltransferase